jgi:uncharacterized membrane protein
MIINFVSAVAYFATRDSKWWDIPVWSVIASAISALLVATAILGEFTKSNTDANIVFLGLGLAYGADLIVMGMYAITEVVTTLYDKIVGRAIQ